MLKNICKGYSQITNGEYIILFKKLHIETNTEKFLLLFIKNTQKKNVTYQ